MNYTFRLTSLNYGEQSIDLYKSTDENSEKELPHISVKNDETYTFEIRDNHYKRTYIQEFYLNNDRINFKIFLSGGNIFRDSFGLIRLGVRIDDELYYTGYIRVYIKEIAVSRNIVNMVDYIYNNFNKHILTEKTKVADETDKNLRMLSQAAQLYERSFINLSENKAGKTVTSETEVDFMHLDRIYPSTIMHIVTHPEKLMPVDNYTGICYNGHNYQPTSTVIRKDISSYNTYENNIVLGFVRTLINDTEKIISEIHEKVKKTRSDKNKNGYIDSKLYVFSNSVSLIERNLNSYIKLRGELETIYHIYSDKFGFHGETVETKPLPTEIFRNEPTYRSIYDTICRWLSRDDIEELQSQFMLSVDSTSRIYEYYCLLKLIISFEALGFTMTKEYTYTYECDYKYENTEYNNTFIFEKDDCTVTLFYQPVIDTEGQNGIGLYRSSSFSVSDYNNANNDEIMHSSYYTPDYIIRKTTADGSAYYILDAKHKRKSDVIKNDMKSMVYKYLFSVAVLDENDRIGGLCVINGKGDENESENIHDVSGSRQRKISPHAYLLTVTGNRTDDNNVLTEYLKIIMSD